MLDAVTGEVLAERAAGIGRATNNVAEYRGLIAGLTAALELDADEVEVRMDSKLVVEQMSGRWQVKHPDMKVLAREAAALAARRCRGCGSPGSRASRTSTPTGSPTRRWTPRVRGWSGGPVATPARPTLPTPGWPSGLGSWRRPPQEPQPPTGCSAGRTRRPPPTTTLLLRHGQTPLSIEKRFSGVGDPSLTDVGVAQVAAAGRRLATSAATAVISSPLTRARQTAQAVADELGLEVEVEDGLRETDFGDWEGYTFGEVREKWPREMDAWLGSTAVAPPFGESFDATTTRVRQARDRVLAKHGGKTVVLVSHVTPIKTLVRIALDAPASSLYRMHLDLACLSEVQWFADGPAVVRSLNDTHHLDGVTAGE